MVGVVSKKRTTIKSPLEAVAWLRDNIHHRTEWRLSGDRPIRAEPPEKWQVFKIENHHEAILIPAELMNEISALIAPSEYRRTGRAYEPNEAGLQALAAAAAES